MRTFGTVLCSMFCVLVFLTGTVVTQALALSAADFGLLKPQSKWNVGIVKTQSTSYCVMTSEFDGDIELTFTRNLEGYSSVAVNFQGSFFKQGMEYEVFLQTEGAESRRFIGRADGGRSLIIQIGLDDGFYLSLKGDGNLRIGLPEMDMTFALREFSTSYISLLDCASKIKNREPRTAAIPVTSVEKSLLTETEKAASPKMDIRKMTDLERRQQSLMQQLIQQGRTAVQLEEQRRAIPLLVKDGLRERELTFRVDRLQEEREDLQLQLVAVRKSIQKNGSATLENKSLKAELLAKRVQLGKTPIVASKKLIAKKKKPEQKESVSCVNINEIIWDDAPQSENAAPFSLREKKLSQSFFALQKERDALRAQLEMVRQFAEESKSVARENNELRMEISNLQSEISVVKSARSSVVDNLRGKLNQARLQISGLTRQLTFMSQQKEKLVLDLEARNNQAKNLQVALGVKDRELLAAEISSMDKERKLSSLQADLVGLKSEHAESLWNLRMQTESEKTGRQPVIQPVIQPISLKREPSLKFNISPSMKEGFYRASSSAATVVVQ